MDDNKTNQVASQTEIPVSEASQTFQNKPPFINRLKIPIIVVIFLLIAGGAFFLISNKSKNNSYDAGIALQKKANESYMKGDLKNTERDLAASLNNYSDNPSALAGLITTIALQGNESGQESEYFKRASQYIEYGNKYFGTKPVVLIAIGYLYETNGQYEEALTYYEKALAIEPENVDGLFHKGHVLQFLGRADEAIELYDRAYKLDSTNQHVLMAKAPFALSQGKAEEAFQLYKAASNAKNIPPHLKAEALTGASIVRRSQILYMKEAIALSEEAVKLYPIYSPGLAAHGYNLSINGNPKDGVEFLKRAIVANPRISKNYSQLGKVFSMVKMYDNAIENQKLAISAIDNDNTILSESLKAKEKAIYMFDLARAYSLSGGNPETITLIQQAISQNSSLLEILKKDYGRGSFKELEQNQDFLTLINS